MKLDFLARRQLDLREKHILEEKISATLRPIKPKAGFVEDLKARLINNENLVIDQPGILRYGFFIFAGIFGGVLLIATSIRAIFTLFVTLGVIKHLRTQSRNTMTAQPVR